MGRKTGQFSGGKNTNIHPKDLSERERFIFTDFQLYLEKYYMKPQALRLSEKSLLFLKNYHIINDLHEVFAEECKKAFEMFADTVKNTFDALGGEWEVNFQEDSDYHQIWKREWKNKHFLDIHFEFQFTKEGLFTDTDISFELHVEGLRNVRSAVVELFEKRRRELDRLYKIKDIDYSPKGSIASIGTKEYKFKLDPQCITAQEISIFIFSLVEEFQFLIDPIDEIVKNPKIQKMLK